MNIFSFCCFGRKRKCKSKPQVENFYFEPECRELECCEKSQLNLDCRELECCEESIIDIQNDYKISNDNIVIFDCMSIIIINCPKITAIPEIQYFKWLEVLIITHCDIKECYTAFPSSLRNLTISYSNMAVFEPRCINIQHLATIDLSFNRLEKIPEVLGEYEGVLNLKNNNFWYNTYSALQYSKVNSAHELAVAYKFNLISTDTINNAIAIL
jgi:Leucine-rich repeat (LRR) protein